MRMKRDLPSAVMASVIGVVLAGGMVSGMAGSARAADIAVEAPFARASAGTAGAGAAYMTLKSAEASADRLSASTPAAERAELHTHVMEGDVMGMREVDSIEIPAGGTVELKPGGLHIMLIGLKAPLKEGESIPLTLSFAKAGPVTVTVPVKSPSEMAPMQGRTH